MGHDTGRCWPGSQHRHLKIFLTVDQKHLFWTFQEQGIEIYPFQQPASYTRLGA